MKHDYIVYDRKINNKVIREGKLVPHGLIWMCNVHKLYYPCNVVWDWQK